MAAADEENNSNEVTASLEKLLEQPPKEITVWVSNQFKELSESDSDVADQAIFKLASDFKSAPLQQKQDLIAGFVAGIEELPLEERTIVVKQVLHVVGPGESSNGDVESGAGQDDKEKALLLKVARLGKEAGLADLQDSERETLVEATKNPKVIQPVLDVVPELNDSDRAAFKTVLVKTNAVPEEKVATLEDGLKPGGLVYQAAIILRWVNLAAQYEWLAFVIPIAELVLGIALPANNSILNAWLVVDSLLGLLGATAAHFAAQSLQPAYEEFRTDPTGMINTAQAAGEGWVGKIPGMKTAATHATVFAVAFAIAVVWAIIGVLFLIVALLSLHAPGTFVVCMVFVIGRILVMIALANFAAYWYGEYNAAQGIAAASENQPDYGTLPPGTEGTSPQG